MPRPGHPISARSRARQCLAPTCGLLALLLVATLLLPACLSGDASDAPAATAASGSSLATPVVASATPSPVATATATVPAAASPTATPTPAATATRTATATPAPDPVPAGQAEDLPRVDLHYTIEVRLTDFDAGRVDAVTTARVTNREAAPLDTLFFRASPAAYNQFVLDTLARDGEALAPIPSDGGTTLEVPLDPPIAAGQTTSLRFAFTLAIGDTHDPFASTTRDGPVLRLGYWYPMLSNAAGQPPLLDPPYTVSAGFDVTLTAPADVVVAAAGTPAGAPAATGSEARYVYTLDRGRDFAFMFSRDFVAEQRATASGILVNMYTIPALYGGDSDTARADLRQRAFATAERALDEYVARVGPYPWPSLALVEAGPSLGGGIEYTALTVISFNSAGIEALVAHEVAHMWFYAAIGTRTQDDPWVDEGAATFFATGVVTSYDAASDRGAGTYVVPLGPSIPELTGFSGAQWVPAVYTQGASFYADTYIAMGPDAFWAAMHAIYDSQVFGIATPYEVLTTFQQHSPVDLRPLYERYFTYDWVGEVAG